jgi:hypothetical protein
MARHDYLAPRVCPRCVIPQAWDAFGAGGANTFCRSCVAKADRVRNSGPKSRASRLRRYYGLTQEQYDEMLERQGGTCGICHTPPPEGKAFHIDHDHACCPGQRTCGDCVRGLLCARCNLGISLMERFPVEVIKWLDIPTVLSKL